MEGCTECTGTTDEIENEVTQLQNSLETSFKNNCKERKHAARKGALWWYPELDKLRKECNNNIRRARRNLIDKETAKTARKRYKSTIRQCKRESWRRFCRSVSGPRPASRLFKILGKDQIISLDNIQVPNSLHISNTEEILRYLLDTHFPGNTPYGDNNSGANYQASDEDWQIATTIVTEERVRWAVAYFARFKSPGIDGIYPVLLQKGIDIIIERLVRLLRASIALRYIPTQWRIARVVFVPKPGRNDYTQPKSFRPISLMSFLLKTTERLIDRHIRDGTLVRYPLHANQHAYLAGKSTDTALHNLVSKTERAVHGKQYALGVFLDIVGAFNNASSGSLLNVYPSGSLGIDLATVCGVMQAALL